MDEGPRLRRHVLLGDTGESGDSPSEPHNDPVLGSGDANEPHDDPVSIPLRQRAKDWWIGAFGVVEVPTPDTPIPIVAAVTCYAEPASEIITTLDCIQAARIAEPNYDICALVIADHENNNVINALVAHYHLIRVERTEEGDIRPSEVGHYHIGGELLVGTDVVCESYVAEMQCYMNAEPNATMPIILLQKEENQGKRDSQRAVYQGILAGSFRHPIPETAATVTPDQIEIVTDEAGHDEANPDNGPAVQDPPEPEPETTPATDPDNGPTQDSPGPETDDAAEVPETDEATPADNGDAAQDPPEPEAAPETDKPTAPDHADLSWPKPLNARYLMNLDADTAFTPSTPRYLAETIRMRSKPGFVVGGACCPLHIREARNMIARAEDFEYLANTALCRCAENAIGFISCLPGACAMLNWGALAAAPEDQFNSILGSYFRGVTDSWEANQLLLGEDRYFSLLLLKQGFRTAFDDRGEATTSGKKSFPELARQRVRWGKSTLACTRFLIQEKKFWADRHFPFLRVLLMLLCSSEFIAFFILPFIQLMIVGVSISSFPAFDFLIEYGLLLVIFLFVVYVCGKNWAGEGESPDTKLTGLYFLCGGFYCVWTFQKVYEIVFQTSGTVEVEFAIIILSVIVSYLLSLLLSGYFLYIVLSFSLIWYWFMIPSFLMILPVLATTRWRDFNWNGAGGAGGHSFNVQDAVSTNANQVQGMMVGILIFANCAWWFVGRVQSAAIVLGGVVMVMCVASVTIKVCLMMFHFFQYSHISLSIRRDLIGSVPVVDPEKETA